MRLLVDSHSLVWTMDDPTQLILSAATIWELAIKVGLGKIVLSLPYRQWMEKSITDLDLSILPITVEYADRQATLPLHHKDPFDRLLIAQALVEGIPIVSADVSLDPYGVTRLW